MNITNVQLNLLEKPIEKNGRIFLGYATLTFDEVLVINSIKVYEIPEKEKIYIEMPKHPIGKEMRDTCFPTNNIFRRRIEKEIVKELKKFHSVTAYVYNI